ncbi:hypothetical protein DFH09DRAFT_1145731 [Mycena vulgaris]|nr:hypothetical protein DFH09DRAFT_1145731 [Mycena vulgaris]
MPVTFDVAKHSANRVSLPGRDGSSNPHAAGRDKAGQIPQSGDRAGHKPGRKLWQRFLPSKQSRPTTETGPRPTNTTTTVTPPQIALDSKPNIAAPSHPASSVSLPHGSYTPRQVLELACKPQAKKAGEILQCSLTEDRGEPGQEGPGETLPTQERAPHAATTQTISSIIPTSNGLVDTVILAYNKHHALVLRPDDVWLAILTQFNYFVNANAELLRASFVAHEGKRALTISAEGTRYTLDFAEMSRQMVGEMEKNVVDPALRAWALPAFTTTTENDTTIAAMLMMATLKAYFEYDYQGIACGIPRVTLEGEKSDWEDILKRLEKLKEYGVQTIAWYHLLVPVISRFVKSFDEPGSPETVEFWQQKGRWKGHRLLMDLQRPQAPETLSAQEFHATYMRDTEWSGGQLQLVLDDVPFHQVDVNDAPPGYAEVDVTLDDNGEHFDCVLTAGLVGTRVSSSNDTALSKTGIDDTVRPLPGWWMYVKK